MTPFSFERTPTMLDLPPVVGEELGRLHRLLLSDALTSEDRIWAREKIEHIHKVYFCGALFVPSESGVNL